ncbi:MAG: orotidine-5'-phosphate decarboxylase [Acidobacteria bacterium]|nr:orotidine-5'-phosphate decarboxylase [Acidobacteriota bacterium]
MDSRFLNPIVVALDVDTASQALSLVDRLRGVVGMFKIGKQLFTAEGPDIVRKITSLGEKVFLDLKYHDIPNTVAKAGVEAARLGVSIFNLHALGGTKMMKTTVETVTEAVERERITRPIILGVTVLTSHTQDSLNEIGIEMRIEDEVVRLARLCDQSGIDGVVASPQEIVPIRKAVGNPAFVILTPGVRPAGSALDDQSRVMTPAQAIRSGANLIVVGRPIIAAVDPYIAAQKIFEEIEPELRQNSSPPHPGLQH